MNYTFMRSNFRDYQKNLVCRDADLSEYDNVYADFIFKRHTLEIALVCDQGKRNFEHVIEDRQLGRWFVKDSKLCMRLKKNIPFIMNISYEKVGLKELCWNVSENDNGFLLNNNKNKDIINLKFQSHHNHKTFNELQDKYRSNSIVKTIK